MTLRVMTTRVPSEARTAPAIDTGVRPSLHGASKAGKLILSSHSGGYHAVATALRLEAHEVHEVFLFDSLYDDAAAFREWLSAAGLQQVEVQLLTPESDPPYFQPTLASGMAG